MCEKNEKELEKIWKRVLKCCLLKKGSKTLNSALSVAWICPLCLKDDFCNLKWILSFNFITLLAIALRTFVIPILSLLANTPSPVTTLDFNLECYVFQFVEFEFSMSIWCHWFSHLSSSIPFMRSYLNMLNNSRNCFLCYNICECLFSCLHQSSHIYLV